MDTTALLRQSLLESLQNKLGSGRRSLYSVVAIVAVAAIGGGSFLAFRPMREGRTGPLESPLLSAAAERVDPTEPLDTVSMPPGQQQAVGLAIAPAQPGSSYQSVSAPGRIVPDPARFAYITPRAPGVIRSVHVNVGQNVHKGDLLATIESAEVGRVRLELRVQSQLMSVAQTEAQWQKTLYDNTTELVAGLQRGDEPDAIQKALEGRPVGPGRDRLMTAYAQYRLASAALARDRSLLQSHAVSASQFEQTRAAYEGALGSYQALLDSITHETRLASLRADQAAHQAQTAVDVAREQLKILGVNLEDDAASRAVPSSTGEPLSLYSIVAPFDGTIAERDKSVPGLPVDLLSRLFTIVDLSTVWVEVNVSESDFDELVDARDGTVRFESPAYPGQSFDGRVVYAGDMVDEASRTVKLLAASDNSHNYLKPGMYVDVQVRCAGGHDAACVPASSILTAEDGAHLYVRSNEGQFQRRAVKLGISHGNCVMVTSGLAPQEMVVTQGASRLEALRKARAEESSL